MVIEFDLMGIQHGLVRFDGNLNRIEWDFMGF